MSLLQDLLVDYRAGKYVEGYGITTMNDDITFVVPATHARRIEFQKNTEEPYFIIEDTLHAIDGKLHTYKAYFHFNPFEAPLVDDVLINDQVISTKQGNITIEALSRNGRWISENRVVHNSILYGNVSRAASVYYSVTSFYAKTVISFKITPHK